MVSGNHCRWQVVNSFNCNIQINFFYVVNMTHGKYKNIIFSWLCYTSTNKLLQTWVFIDSKTVLKELQQYNGDNLHSSELATMFANTIANPQSKCSKSLIVRRKTLLGPVDCGWLKYVQIYWWYWHKGSNYQLQGPSVIRIKEDIHIIFFWSWGTLKIFHLRLSHPYRRLCTLKAYIWMSSTCTPTSAHPSRSRNNVGTGIMKSIHKATIWIKSTKAKQDCLSALILATSVRQSS